jgi:hypothetical protein
MSVFVFLMQVRHGREIAGIQRRSQHLNPADVGVEGEAYECVADGGAGAGAGFAADDDSHPRRHSVRAARQDIRSPRAVQYPRHPGGPAPAG